MAEYMKAKKPSPGKDTTHSSKAHRAQESLVPVKIPDPGGAQRGKGTCPGQPLRKGLESGANCRSNSGLVPTKMDTSDAKSASS